MIGMAPTTKWTLPRTKIPEEGMTFKGEITAEIQTTEHGKMHRCTRVKHFRLRQGRTFNTIFQMLANMVGIQVNISLQEATEARLCS